MAISALILGGILAGSGAVQRNTAFTSAIDAVRLQLKEVQNEANQNVSTRLTGTPGSSDFTTFGKLVELQQSNPNVMKTWTLIEDSSKANLYECDEHDIELAEQAEFQHATQDDGSTKPREAIIFGNNPKQTYLVPTFSDPSTGTSPACNAATATVTPSPNPTLCPGFTRTQSNPAGSCPIPPPPARPQNCTNDPAYQCGLYGQYYTDTDLLLRIETSDYIDTQIGTNMGNGASSYPLFKPTLIDRAQNPTNGVSVHWSGEILLEGDPSDSPTPQSHDYCFTADEGSKATITVGATTYKLTNNYGANNPTGSGCVTIPASTPPGWYPIDIEYGHVPGGPLPKPTARLTYTVSGPTYEVPGNELRTLVTNKPSPPMADFANGLYGQYYDDTILGNRISAYTDPLIGDGGSNFSFDSSHTNAFTGAITAQDNSFSPALIWNTAGSSASQKSVRWTGQIKLNPTNAVKYCEISDSQATVTIAGTVLISDTTPHLDNRTCATISVATTGWYNIEVDYVKQGVGSTPPDGTNASVQLSYFDISSNKYVEVSHNQLRRPLDWTTDGNRGSCNVNNFQCNQNGDYQPQGSSLVENTGSSTSDGTCGGTNHLGEMTYTASNLTADTGYNLDISYFNDGDKDVFGSLVPPPPSYRYDVCVSVNGKMQNGGNPIHMPIGNPSLNPRTYTLTGINVGGGGNATVVLDWINDTYSPTWYLGSGFGGYDSNLAITRLDLYRNLLPDGTLSLGAPKPSTNAKSHTIADSQPALAARLFNLIAPPAQASASCDKNVLNPANYTGGCFATAATAGLDFQFAGYSDTGTITVSSQDGSIERNFH